jgi:N-acetylmuramoyl-L-alanine amidase
MRGGFFMLRKRKRLIIWLNRRGAVKLIMAAALTLLIAMVFTYEVPSTKTWSYWTLPLSGKIIAIDPGHGGPDGGAVSKEGAVEKEINLAIALYLRDYLQQAGALVVMTRETDKDLADPELTGYSKRKTQDLLRRAALIEQNNADLYISIHMNSIPSSRWHGAQTFYYPGHPDNKTLAAFIQNEIKQNVGNTNREIKTEESVYLLKTLKMPGALVEVGFLSNPEEARLLADKTYQKKMAAAIYRGIFRYATGEKLGSA